MSGYVYIGEGSGYVFATYWETINATSGVVQIPPGGSVKLDAFQDLEDAVVSTITSGLPDFNAATTSGGTRVVASFDTGGNYSLSPEPSSYPVALMFRVVIPEANIDWNSANLVLEDVHRVGGSGEVDSASNVGTGAEIFKQLSSGNLEFRTLTAGSNVTITENTNTITIESTGGSGSGNSYFPGGW